MADEIIQGSEAWFAARAGKLTASRMADVLATVKSGEAASRKNYRAQLVAERLTGQPAGDEFKSAAMQRGNEEEAAARELYAFMHDVMVEQVGFIDHPSVKWAGASPDGLVSHDGLVEIKCPNTATHIDYLLEGVVPNKYKPQMAWQLSCTGREYCDFVSYDSRMPTEGQLFVVRYIPDPRYLAELKIEAETFLAEVALTVERLRDLWESKK